MVGWAALACAAHHPANAPAAQAKVSLAGAFELKVRFDVLAFCLGVPPSEVTDPEMNALLDGPQANLDARLAESKSRFVSEIRVIGSGGEARIDTVEFPTVQAIRVLTLNGSKQRLPVMATMVLRGTLPDGSKSISVRLPEALGPLVLTTEFPYCEPISAALEPGAASGPIPFPTEAEVEAAKRSFTDRMNSQKHDLKLPNLPTSQIQAGIQAQYNAWSAAYMKNEVETLLGMLSPEYTLTTADNRVIERPEYEATLNLRRRANSDTSSYSTQILKLTLDRDAVQVISRETSVSHVKNEKSGVVETVNHMHDYLDRWIYLEGKWLLSSTVTQRELTQIK